MTDHKHNPAERYPYFGYPQTDATKRLRAEADIYAHAAYQEAMALLLDDGELDEERKKLIERDMRSNAEERDRLRAYARRYEYEMCTSLTPMEWPHCPACCEQLEASRAARRGSVDIANIY